jgi:signal transduction histidine kinase/CheY-like chemotaxis protein
MSDIVPTLRVDTPGRLRQWWLDRPVRRKAVLAGALPLVVMVGVLGGAGALEAYRSDVRHDSQRTRAAIAQGGVVRERLDTAEVAALRAAAAGRAGGTGGAGGDDTGLAAALAALPEDGAAFEAAAAAALGSPVEVTEALAAAAEALEGLAGGGAAEAAEAAGAATDEARLALDTPRAALDERREDRAAEVERAADLSSALLGGGLALALTAGLAAAVVTTRGVVGRIEGLTSNVDRFVAGEPVVPTAPAGDEIGRLTSTLEVVSIELDRRQEALAASRDEALAATRAKDEFLSRMSHELRTPLTAIIGFGQLLQMEDLGEDDRESVDHIVRAGHHLLALINEVLDIAKIETGHLSLSVEPVDLGEVAAEAVALLAPQAAERRVAVAMGVPAGTTVLADRQRLKQVLVNLLSNAVKYNPVGGDARLAVDPGGGDRARITVTDTGMGIPEAAVDRVWAPFDRLDAAHSTIEGTGVGLALSKHLVEAMGGTIGFTSRLSYGTTFWVELPRATDTAAAAAPAGAEPAAAGHAPARPVPGAPPARPDVVPEPDGSVVLYVEDNLANLRLVERVFRHRPERLEVAMQGRRTVELARQLRPRLVLLDLNLPDIDGDVVLRMLKADAATASVPVVIISADATARRSDQLLALGAAAYLAKPIDVAELLAVLDRTASMPLPQQG